MPFNVKDGKKSFQVKRQERYINNGWAATRQAKTQINVFKILRVSLVESWNIIYL
jgi:hypothetical protein